MNSRDTILNFLSHQQDIHFGYSEILFVPAANELKEPQPGYILIANDETGDPILVDTSTPELRVCTASALNTSVTQRTAASAQNANATQAPRTPEPIADSLETFTGILTRLRILAAGRENPVQKELNPLSAREARDFLKFVKTTNPNTDPGYWETLMLLALENDTE